MMFRVVTAFFLLPSCLFAQEHVPRDTSYTVHSTWMKLKDAYPFISPVVSQPSGRTRLFENIEYGVRSNRVLRLDIIHPGDDSLHPGVLMIHGGGWRSGSKEMTHAMAYQLAKHGFVAVPVEYRLSVEARYPAAVYDLKAAVRWLRLHASRYNIDTQRIAVYGCSAGGTLAALVGTTAGVAEFEEDIGHAGVPSSVRAIVDIDGVLDFTHPAESGKDTGSAPTSAAAAFLGATYNEKPGLWRAASPVNHVSEATPPILFVNSSLDRFHAGRDEMIARLATFGIYSEVHTIPDTPHGFWLFHPWFEETASRVVGFLTKILRQGE